MSRRSIVPAVIGFLLGGATVAVCILLVPNIRFGSGQDGPTNFANAPTVTLHVPTLRALALDSDTVHVYGGSTTHPSYDGPGDHYDFVNLWIVIEGDPDGKYENIATLSGTMVRPNDPTSTDKQITALLYVQAHKPIRLEIGKGLKDVEITTNRKTVSASQPIDLVPGNARLIITANYDLR